MCAFRVIMQMTESVLKNLFPGGTVDSTNLPPGVIF